MHPPEEARAPTPCSLLCRHTQHPFSVSVTRTSYVESSFPNEGHALPFHAGASPPICRNAQTKWRSGHSQYRPSDWKAPQTPHPPERKRLRRALLHAVELASKAGIRRGYPFHVQRTSIPQQRGGILGSALPKMRRISSSVKLHPVSRQYWGPASGSASSSDGGIHQTTDFPCSRHSCQQPVPAFGGNPGLIPAVCATKDPALPLLHVAGQGDISLGIQLVFERTPVFRGNGHADAYRNPAVLRYDGTEAHSSRLSMTFPGS